MCLYFFREHAGEERSKYKAKTGRDQVTFAPDLAGKGKEGDRVILVDGPARWRGCTRGWDQCDGVQEEGGRLGEYPDETRPPMSEVMPAKLRLLNLSYNTVTRHIPTSLTTLTELWEVHLGARWCIKLP